MRAAINNAPNEKIAQQLEMLLRRLEMTGGEVANLPCTSIP